MHIINNLDPSDLLILEEGIGKGALLDRMSAALLRPKLQRQNPHLTVEMIRSAILLREASSATGIGDGMAFPHARIKGFRGLGLSLAILRKPLDFGGGAQGPVRMVCMIVVPEEMPMLSLKIMSRMARVFRSAELRETLVAAATREEAFRILTSSDLTLDIPVTAKDIMDPCGPKTGLDTTLREVSRILHAQRLDVIAVVDAEGRLEGEILCDRLFQFGLPEFFQQLKSVSFISEFDPFEKYFEQEAHSCARDLVSRDICRMPPESTLLELVFELVVKRRRQIYIVDAQGKWIGTVDRAAVLNNVLNW